MLNAPTLKHLFHASFGETETPADIAALSCRFCYNMCRRVHLDAD